MAAIALPRRSFLRGLGGIAIGLPALEAMMPSRASAGGMSIPKRYVVSYCGASIGKYTGPTSADHGDVIVPAEQGLGYTPTGALLPLLDHGVADEVSIVSGLKIPWGPEGNVPAGGRPHSFHACSVLPQLAGTRVQAHGSAYTTPTGPTSDQIVADQIAGDTPHKYLGYRVQPIQYNYSASMGNSGRLSFRDDGTGIVALDPTVSPRTAYESLFTTITPDDPEAAAQFEQLRQRRRSALDVVSDNSRALMARLGGEDRRRLERHFDEIRAQELLLEQLTVPGTNCELLGDPGDDPSIGADWVGGEDQPSGGQGYSNEELRATLLSDYIHMGFACDVSRVAALQYTSWKSWMSIYELTGFATDLHGATHGGASTGPLTAGIGWHVGHFARLIEKLRDTPEIDGQSMLDHTVLIMLFEGGHGFDPEDGALADSHSTENMAVLIAGGRACGLQPGQHVVATDQHPAQVVNTAMHAVGVDAQLGEVAGDIPKLWA